MRHVFFMSGAHEEPVAVFDKLVLRGGMEKYMKQATTGQVLLNFSMIVRFQRQLSEAFLQMIYLTWMHDTDNGEQSFEWSSVSDLLIQM